MSGIFSPKLLSLSAAPSSPAALCASCARPQALSGEPPGQWLKTSSAALRPRSSPQVLEPLVFSWINISGWWAVQSHADYLARWSGPGSAERRQNHCSASLIFEFLFLCTLKNAHCMHYTYMFWRTDRRCRCALFTSMFSNGFGLGISLCSKLLGAPNSFCSCGLYLLISDNKLKRRGFQHFLSILILTINPLFA